MFMRNAEEKRAKKLERLLKKGGTCHDPALGSLQEISNSLQRSSEAKGSEMSSDVMAKQRAILMSKSEEIKSTNVVAKEAAKGPSVSQCLKEAWGRLGHSWKMSLAPVGAMAFVAIIIFTLVLPRGVTVNPQGGITRRIADLIIPAAMAADAFTFQAETEDVGGASTSTTFLIHSKIDLSADDLARHIVIAPSRVIGDDESKILAVRVEKVDQETFRVIPAAPLEVGTAYRVELRAAVQAEGGELQARTFSWAIQTKDVFRVLSSVPSDASNTVPVNTVIEVTVSMDRWSDPAAHFSIKPEVKGKFQTKGRTITFIPDQPLAYGTVYIATWNKDWGMKDSDVTLGKDEVIRFETMSKMRAEVEQRQYHWINPSYPFVASAPGKAVRIPVYTYGKTEPSQVNIEGYVLSRERAASYLAEDGKRPWYSRAGREYGTLEASYAKERAFVATSTIQTTSWVEHLLLPSTINAGFYLLKLTSADDVNPVSSWVFLNVTNTAVYMVADKDQSIVWAMHVTENRPIEGMTVSDGSQTAKTDKDGIARLKTSAAIARTVDNTDAEHPSTVLSIGEGSSGTLLPLSDSMDLRSSFWWYGSNIDDPADRTVAYLHHDRPLYRPTDTAELSGIIQDRETGRKPFEPVTVSLMQNCTEWSCPEDRSDVKMFERVTVTPDERGFFRANLSWNSVGAQWYVLVLKRGDTVIRSQSIEIRNYIKPDYTLESATDVSEVFAGEKITGTARAAFFDGTPLSNLELSINELKQSTNDDGMVSFTFDTNVPNCDIEQNPKANCPSATYFSIAVAPTESESTSNIQDYSSVYVWNTDINLVPDWNTRFDGDKATVSVRANRVTLPSEEEESRKPISNLSVRAVVLEHWWEKVQTGTGYNEIEKTTYPTYRYDEREVASAPLEGKTDVKGNVSFSFQTKEDRSYTVVMYAKDEKGRWSVTKQWVYPCRSCYYNSSSDVSGQSENESTYISFGPTETHRESYTYRTNEVVSLSLTNDDQLLPRTSSPTYLYVKAHMGILDAKASTDPTIAFPFIESYAPNVSVKAIAFRKGGFREYTTGVYYNTEDRKLSIDLSTDNETYSPGGEATIRVKVKDEAGKPKSDTRVSIAVVDEALFKVANGSVDEDSLGSLYQSVSSGILFSAKTHRSDEDVFGGGGGGEYGGGGNEPSRKNFKDTAAYEVVTTNASGEGEVKIKLPDNITTWRVSGVAASPDRYAGNGRSSIKVTKRVFVNVVVPETFLEADRPKMKLRAYGVGLKTGEDITYTVDAPTLEMKAKEVKAKAGESVFVDIDRPVAGTHAVTIRLKSSSGTDALEKKVTIVSSRFERDEGMRTNVTTDTTLDIGTAPDVRISFVPKNRAQYLQDVNSLRWGWSQRIEGLVASRLAGTLLRDYFGEDVSEGDTSLFLNYQKSDGGIAILPHASSDVALSSRVAYTFPEGFDRVQLAQYFRDQLTQANAPREVQIEALSGLAAIGEPVLLDLRSVMALKDLTWREKLSLMRGLVAIGDLEAARPFLNEFLDGKETKDDALMADVSDKDEEDKEATVQLAAIAIRLGDTRANLLRNAVRNMWYSNVYTPLARIDFLKAAVPSAIGGEASVTYEVDGKKTKIALTDGWPRSVDLIAREVRNFKIVEVSGPVELTYLKRVATKPQTDARIKLTRTYLQDGKPSSDVLKDGGKTITVELKAEFASDAPGGCYTIQDHVPAGFSAMTGWDPWASDYSAGYVSPFEAESPTFVLCKGWQEKPIHYRVKPTARGSYTAEPAVIQHMDHSDVTALSNEQRITIE